MDSQSLYFSGSIEFCEPLNRQKADDLRVAIRDLCSMRCKEGEERKKVVREYVFFPCQDQVDYDRYDDAVCKAYRFAIRMKNKIGCNALITYITTAAKECNITIDTITPNICEINAITAATATITTTKQDGKIDYLTLSICDETKGLQGENYHKWILSRLGDALITPAQAYNSIPKEEFRENPKLYRRAKIAEEQYYRQLAQIGTRGDRHTYVICPAERLQAAGYTSGTGKTSFAYYLMRTVLAKRRTDIYKCAKGKNMFDGCKGQNVLFIDDYDRSNRPSYANLLILSEPHPREADEIDARYHNAILAHNYLVMTTNLTLPAFFAEHYYYKSPDYVPTTNNSRTPEQERFYGAYNADDPHQLYRRIDVFYVIDAPDEAYNADGTLSSDYLLPTGGLDARKLIATPYKCKVTGNNLRTKELHYEQDNTRPAYLGSEYVLFDDDNYNDTEK